MKTTEKQQSELQVTAEIREAVNAERRACANIAAQHELAKGNVAKRIADKIHARISTAI